MTVDYHTDAHTDADLVAALNTGDRKAFEIIYRKYVRDLYRYARKNVEAKEDCEEIVQEVFTFLWERHSTLSIHTSLKNYLLGIVRHKVIHHFRKSVLKRKYVEHFMLFEAVYEARADAEPDDASVHTRLEKLINELPERCQEALRLRLTEELSNNEIARRMNITTRTVEGYMFRAFNYIRNSYRES